MNEIKPLPVNTYKSEEVRKKKYRTIENPNFSLFC